jgi:putative transcriptional regulator
VTKRRISSDDRKSKDHARPRAGDFPDNLLDDGTDWARILTMPDEDAYQNAFADDNSQPLTPKQLARMRRAPNPKAIWHRLEMDQQEFARRFEIGVGTLREWEQGQHLPDSTATAYLRVIERDPEAVIQALEDLFGSMRSIEDFFRVSYPEIAITPIAIYRD